MQHERLVIRRDDERFPDPGGVRRQTRGRRAVGRSEPFGHAVEEGPHAAVELEDERVRRLRVVV